MFSYLLKSRLVNEKRVESDLYPLDIIVVDLISALDQSLAPTSNVSISTNISLLPADDKRDLSALSDTKVSSTEIRRFYNREANKKN